MTSIRTMHEGNEKRGIIEALKGAKKPGMSGAAARTGIENEQEIKKY